jgi:hypothetical protein
MLASSSSDAGACLTSLGHGKAHLAAQMRTCHQCPQHSATAEQAGSKASASKPAWPGLPWPLPAAAALAAHLLVNLPVDALAEGQRGGQLALLPPQVAHQHKVLKTHLSAGQCGGQVLGLQEEGGGAPAGGQRRVSSNQTASMLLQRCILAQAVTWACVMWHGLPGAQCCSGLWVWCRHVAKGLLAAYSPRRCVASSKAGGIIKRQAHLVQQLVHHAQLRGSDQAGSKVLPADGLLAVHVVVVKLQQDKLLGGQCRHVLR